MDAAGDEEARADALQDWLVPIGLLLVLGGAIAVVVGEFLPLVHSPDARVAVEHNFLLRFGIGWFVLFGAVAVPSLAFGRWLGADVPWWIVSMLGAIGVVVAVLLSLEINSWSLLQFDYLGPFPPITTELEPDVAVWVIALGSAVAALGGCLLVHVPAARERPTAAAPPPEGWYPDPEDSHQLRWWDGDGWTGARRPPGAQQRYAPPLAHAPVDATRTVAEAREAASRGFPDAPERPPTLWRRPENDPPPDER